MTELELLRQDLMDLRQAEGRWLDAFAECPTSFEARQALSIIRRDIERLKEKMTEERLKEIKRQSQ